MASDIVTEVLDEAAIRARLAAATTAAETLDEVRAVVQATRQEMTDEQVAAALGRYSYVRPLAQAADSLVEYLQNSEGRYMFGLREVDVMMRGIGRGELAYLTGFAFSGKTQLFLNSVLHNRHRNIVLFTLDEPSELVLAKLVGLREGWNFEWVEVQIRQRNTDVINRVKEIAAVDFQNLLVIDSAHTLANATDAMREAEDYFGSEVDAVGIDYLELWDGDDVDGKSQALKRWTLDENVPVLCVHQGGKGEAGKGQPITLSTLRFGGHAEAIFIVGVRRKRDWEELDHFMRLQNENTVSISVVKNKRPPAKRGEFDYFLDPNTGLIRAMTPGDVGTPQEHVKTDTRPLGESLAAVLALRQQEKLV